MARRETGTSKGRSFLNDGVRARAMAVLAVTVLVLAGGEAGAMEPGEGVLKIQKRVVLPRWEGASVEEFTFDVVDPFDSDAAVISDLVPRAGTDGRRPDPLSGSVSAIVPADFTGLPLDVRERPEPEWVATYAGDCDAFGRITVPAGGFATCEVTNTFIPDSDMSDTVLTLFVSIVSGEETRTTNEFAYVVENDDGAIVAGPVSATGDDRGSAERGGRPSTTGTAIVALDYTTDDPFPPTFEVLVQEQPEGWVTNFGGDCGSDGRVDSALRTPTCTLVHLFIGGDLAPGEGVLEIEKTLVVPQFVGGSVEEFLFDVVDPFDEDADVATGLVPQPWSTGTFVDATRGSVATVIPGPVTDRPLEVREWSELDWVTTYAGGCDSMGRVTVPADGFAICEVTNTFLEGSGDSDTVLTLVVSIEGAANAATTDDFAYVVENQDGVPIAGPVSAMGGDSGSAERGGAPSTHGTAMVALDYTTEDPIPPTFNVVIDEQPNGWVTNFGGDCSPDGDVDPALRDPVCTLLHLFVDDDVNAGEGVLVIEKQLIAPPSVGASVEEFVFDVTDPTDNDAEVATGLVPQPASTGTFTDASRGSVATVVDAAFTGHPTEVTERPVPEWVTTYGGACDEAGLVTVPADGFATCTVTNTFVEGSEGSDALLTLVVSIESAGDTATTEQFAYVVKDDEGAVVAGPVSAESDSGNSQRNGAPSTEGTAVLPLDYTPPDRGPSDPPPTFGVLVDEQPNGWATNFGDDCDQGGGVDAATSTPTCSVTHLFIGEEPNEPGPQAPIAVDDYVSVEVFPFIINADVLANDFDADGDLDPASLSVAVPPACAAAGVDQCIVSLPGAGIIRVDALVFPLTDRLTYQVCDATNRCDTAVLAFFAGLPPAVPFFRDADEDDFGDPENFIDGDGGVPPPGYVLNSGDCDDSRSDVNPDAPEVPDGVDNDCDGLIDEA